MRPQFYTPKQHLAGQMRCSTINDEAEAGCSSTDGSQAVERALQVLQGGGTICYPTETFFAVGCMADDRMAIQHVFSAKQRSSAMPLPVVIGGGEQLELLTDCRHIASSLVQKLAETFWPGPLSILVPAAGRVPDVLTGGTGQVAVRVSPHPVARKLCLAAGAPLVSSSANISGRPAVTQAAALDPELVAATGGVLDMPPAPAGGKPSTLVQISGADTVRILRHGAVAAEELVKANVRITE